MHSKVSIPKTEVKRQLGYQQQTVSNQNIDNLITKVIIEAQSLLKPQGNYRRLTNINISADKVNLGAGALVFQSQDIADLLANQEQVVVMAVTIGPDLEAQVEQYFANNQLNRATILDAVGSVAVEEVANQLQQRIAKEAKQIALPSLTMRYSPGYGDLDLEIQPQLLELVNGKQLGITTNDSFLLIPQKSITALIGLGRAESAVTAKCDFNCHSCEYDTCVYK
ncbi:MAG: vitamin B12 dependent-methionine synthase activation domain-containing protein [Bacillota bacterium]